jgi:flagellar assembly protein FliH
MGLIKADAAPAVVRFKWRDIQDEANQLLEDAKRQADTIRQVAREEGYRDGQAQGREEGREEAFGASVDEHAEQLTQVILALRGAVGQVEQSGQQVRADSICDVVELSVAIARRVTKRQAMFDPQVLIENLRESVALAGRGRQLRIAINPEQRQVLAAALPQLQIEWPALATAQIVEDATLVIGGCRVFTDHGQVDADIDNQLDRVVSGLMPCASKGEAA